MHLEVNRANNIRNSKTSLSSPSLISVTQIIIINFHPTDMLAFQTPIEKFKSWSQACGIASCAGEDMGES